MLKPVDPAAIAHLNLPGWSVSPAYLYVEADEVPMKFGWHLCSTCAAVRPR